MDCSIYCTASAYQLLKLHDALRGQYKSAFYRDAVHIEASLEGKSVDIFYFSYGVTVCWGVPQEKGKEFLKNVKKFEDKGFATVETDHVTYAYGEKAKFADDHITLPNKKILTKLAISFGLAQSVKLEVFEKSILRIYDQTKYIPEHLAMEGKIPLSRRQIRCKMGELFLERSSISLHLNILDKPEFFWDHYELEPLYSAVAYEMDLEDRAEVLNQRLETVRELFEMLGNELNHQHSNRLEWIIIGLIVSEVILTLSKDVFHIL